MLELARDPYPSGETRSVGAEGAQGYLLGRPAPMPAEAPSYATTLATLSVLTATREHRRIAAALQGGDELYRVLLRTVPDMVVALFDREMRCQVIDGGLESLDQWRAILEGKTVREALGPEDGGEQMDALLRPALDGVNSEFEWLGRRSGIVLAVQAVPVRDERAGVIGVMAVCRDVTPRPQADAPARSARAGTTGAPAPSR
jgi:PAS domain S-box-containing protein